MLMAVQHESENVNFVSLQNCGPPLLVVLAVR